MRHLRLWVIVGIILLLTGALAFSESWWAKAAMPYKGVTIRGISESTPPSKYVKEVLVPLFEKETGIKVMFETTSWDQMYDKSIKDMDSNTGIYDFVYVEQDIVYSYMNRNFLVDLTEFMNQHPELVFPDLDLPDFTEFINYYKDPQSGHIFGLPFEAFLKLYVYRKDLFEDPEIKAEFKEEYGWDLRPPKTPEEHEQIAKFFTEYGKKHKMKLWGTTVQAASHPASFYELVETIWPSWGIYNWGINMEIWRASVEHGGMLNSERAKQAFRWWIELLKYAPPEARQSTWDEVAASMAAGRAAEGWIYGENIAWIATDPTRSAVVSKIGVELPPLYPGVCDDVIRGKGYLGYYDGGALSIPYSSKKKEAAFLFLQWVSRKDFQGDFAAKTARVVRKSTFDDPKLKEVDPKIDYYFTKMREWGKLFAGAPPFPFHSVVREAMFPFIVKAIAGEISPEEALDKAAAEVDKTLEELGYGR